MTITVSDLKLSSVHPDASHAVLYGVIFTENCVFSGKSLAKL
jgi:hypothetical protein